MSRVRVDEGGNVTPGDMIRETENRVDSKDTFGPVSFAIIDIACHPLSPRHHTQNRCSHLYIH